MKKIARLLVVAAVAGIALTSCGGNTEKCWKATYRLEADEYVEYAWCTESELKAAIEKLRAEGYTNIGYSAVEEYRTQIDCEDNNY